MGDDPGRVEPAGADEAEEIGAVPERLADQAGDRQAPQERLAGRDRERLVDEHADHDDPAGDPDDGQGGLEGGAVAGRLDDEVGALVAGDVVDGVERVLRPGVDRDRPERLGFLQPVGDDVDGDDHRAPEERRTHRDELAERTGADHRHDVPRPGPAPLQRRVGRGEDVAGQQDVVIGEALRDRRQRHVGERYPHVLRLPAGQIAEGDAVAEHAEAGAAPVLHPQAGRTAAAGAEHRGHAPLPGDDVEDAGADLDDLAGELVAADHPGLDAGDLAVVEVQVGAADGAGRDLDEGVGRFDELRFGHRLDPQVAGPVGADGVHRWRPG